MDILCSVHDINDNRGFGMSDYNWCHGPKCHERNTTTRVRGVKGSKVLRTIKIKYREPKGFWFKHWWNYFCDQTCLMEFVNHNIKGMLNLAPRPEALETPIEDPVRKQVGPGWYHTEIKKIETQT